MLENFEQDSPKQKASTAPLKFERMTDSALEQTESKLFQGLRVIEEDINKKYMSLSKSSSKDPAVAELMKDYRQQISDLNKTFSEDELQTLAKSRKYEFTDERIQANALSVFDFDDATLTFSFCVGYKGENKLISVVNILPKGKKDEPPVKYF